LSRRRDASLQQEQGASLFNRPAIASHSAPAHDFSQVSALTNGSATAMFRAVPSSTPTAFAGGRGSTPFLEQKAGKSAQAGITAGKNESVQAMLLQRSLAGNLSNPAQAAYFRPTNY
jgi:hypothetical protein